MISIVVPIYNEEENIQKLYLEVKNILRNQNQQYEFIVIDNNSNDNTVNILRAIAKDDKNFKVILNSKNFGHIRSPFHALKFAKGDCVICLASDFEDPPELLINFIELWKKGHKVVMARKRIKNANFFTKVFKNSYYKLLKKFSNLDLPIHTTGMGLYDKSIISNLLKLNDPYPYFRAMISEITDKIKYVDFEKPDRKYGKSKNNLFSLYDMGISALVKYTNFPMRLLVYIGFLLSVFSLLISVLFFLYKIFYWSSFDVGIAPLVIGVFLIFSFLILILGIIGEYLIEIIKQTRNVPLVFEEERINFD